MPVTGEIIISFVRSVAVVISLSLFLVVVMMWLVQGCYTRCLDLPKQEIQKLGRCFCINSLFSLTFSMWVWKTEGPFITFVHCQRQRKMLCTSHLLKNVIFSDSSCFSGFPIPKQIQVRSFFMFLSSLILRQI